MTSGEYRDMSAKDALEKINNHTLLLPDIQREYVWNPEDVESLFESIIDGYPIGSCIFWKTTKAIINTEQPNLYYFLDHCERENSRAPKDATTNEKAPEFMTTDANYYVVLDGQQRITSLNIALRGYFEIKKRYKRANISSAWERKELYYNLDFYDSEPNDEHPIKRFRFLTETEAKSGTYYRVKNILACSDANTFIKDVKARTHTQRLNPQVRRDLKILYQRLIGGKTHKDKNSALHYFCISEENYDKALDIFVRVNSTGKKLSKSDLLFSTLINGWKEGKDVVTNTLHDMNAKGDGFNFSRDYLMRAALILIDQSVSLKIKSFTPKAITKIRDNWHRIHDAMNQMTDLLADIGLYDERMTSYNASIPLAYYCYKGGEFKTQDSKKEAKKFLAIAMTKGLFGVASNDSLQKTHDTLKNLNCQKTNFSVSLFKDITLTGSRTFTVSKTEIENWIDTFEKGNNTYILLTLLYPHLKLDQHSFHQDHCHPWALFENRKIAELGLSPTVVEKWQKMRNRLPNLHFLEGGENESKNKTPLKDWVEAGHDFEYHPAQVSLELKNFARFYKLRRELILNELKSVFDLS